MKPTTSDSEFRLHIEQNYPLIAKVNLDLANLKNFTATDLSQLCQELRAFITEQVALHGGHLASNLGVIELTVALLRTYDFTKDRLIWDVGHQCYAWKILTYRASGFANLREKDGLAGFPKPTESEFDHFGTGHATTSISAALGMAAAFKEKGLDHKVIAVIGDGALTGGMAWEALNNISELEPNLLIILNDNTMSIDKNVGFVADELGKLRLNAGYLAFKLKLKTKLNSLGQFGQTLLRIGRISKAKLRSKLGKTREFFCERYGCRYYGPLNGHDLLQVEASLQGLKTFKRPALLHIVTEKGHGYAPATNDPTSFHGVKRNDERLLAACYEEPLKTKAEANNKLSYTDAFQQMIMEMAEKEDFACITAAMASGTGLKAFSEKYPTRFYDVGIAEQHAVCFAAGLVSQGVKTVCAIYDTFLQRALDAVIHDVCLQNLPLILAIDRAGLVGQDGATHQGIYSLAFLVALPNLKIINSSDPYMLQVFLQQALKRKLNYPLALRYPRANLELPAFLPKARLAEYQLDRTYANVYEFVQTIPQNLETTTTDWSQIENSVELAQFLKAHAYKLNQKVFVKTEQAAAKPTCKFALTILTSGRLVTNCLQALFDLISQHKLEQPICLIDCFDYSLSLAELKQSNSLLRSRLQVSERVLILEESSGLSPLYAALYTDLADFKHWQVMEVKNLGNDVIEQGEIPELLANYRLDRASLVEDIPAILAKGKAVKEAKSK